MNKKIIVVPTYNESENIIELTNSLKKIEADIVFVDDNSPDKTQEIIKSHNQYNESIFLISRDRKDGYASACIEGIKYSIEKGYKYVIQMDADLSHSAKDLSKLIEASESNDLVIGSRYVKEGKTSGWGLDRIILSKGANAFAKIYLNQNINDLTSGFRIYKSEILNHIELEQIKSEGYGFLVEILYKITLISNQIKEVPIHFNDRKFGKSKMDSKIILEAMKLVITLPFRTRFFS